MCAAGKPRTGVTDSLNPAAAAALWSPSLTLIIYTCALPVKINSLIASKRFHDLQVYMILVVAQMYTTPPPPKTNNARVRNHKESVSCKVLINSSFQIIVESFPKIPNTSVQVMWIQL